jgi:hypothetical protein
VNAQDADYAKMALDIKFCQGYMTAMGTVQDDPVVKSYAHSLSWIAAHLMEISDKKDYGVVEDEREKAERRP